MKVKPRSTAELVLRPYRVLDRKVWNEAIGADSGDARTALDHEDFKSVVRRHRRGMRKDLLYVLGIFHRDGQHLGTIDIYVLARLDLQLGHVGYRLHPAHRGKGFGTAALRLAIEVAFKDLDLQRLEAYIDPSNRRSIKLAERAGMQNEGLRPKSSWQEGAWRDHVAYAIVQSNEFRAPKVRATLDSCMR